ncbi:acetyltransferase, ribosomal protein N-acetylase [Owenweeksia hongkongensis DSM 17368]|uniref:Acetyltransferase, ribosomal protein N-acetylase n=1 Tax=Owenweeksia hongkongensis (strain DSM 17368 / CIP 108786 / JCM 12287 / NRRL B-23963 / UST20020801) TaxID=926562 RepID=G8QZG8_OWEHD|nr:GNAT family N-acetyltransferase [Owenweeksia hongkongensis]AEV32596.1 acetyltransferase, ribosomal protein N-acetylase [Owenweeksia hongkongensis DSM 17368]
MNYEVNKKGITSPSILYSERLILKPVSEGLRDYVFQGLSDHEVRHNMQLPTLNTKEKQDAWWQKFSEWRNTGKAVQWCVFDKKTDRYIGLLTIKEIEISVCRGEIGYSILKEHWRKGYGKEAAARVLQYAFEDINLHTVFAMISPQNEGSQRIVRGMGMMQEAHFKDIHFFEGKFYDLLQFSIINPSHLK